MPITNPLVLSPFEFDRVTLEAEVAITAGQFVRLNADGKLVLPDPAGTTDDAPLLAGVASRDIAAGTKGLIYVGGLIRMHLVYVNGQRSVAGRVLYARGQLISTIEHDDGGNYSVGAATQFVNEDGEIVQRITGDGTTEIETHLVLWSVLRGARL